MERRDARATLTVHPLVVPRAADGGRQPQLPRGGLLVEDVGAACAQTEINDAVGRHDVEAVDGQVF